MRVTRILFTQLVAGAMIAAAAPLATAAQSADAASKSREAAREASAGVSARAAGRSSSRYQGRNRVEETNRETKTARIGANGLLELKNIAGDITISAGSGDTATIEITKVARGTSAEDAREQLGLVTVEMEERSGRAEVVARYPEGTRRGNRRNIDVVTAYRVTAPAGARIDVQSISGNVTTSGITGDLTLNTISGDVRIDKAGKVVKGQSISGNVELLSAADDAVVDLSSTSGNVSARNVRVRKLDLGSVSGNVRGADLRCDSATLHSMSGNVEYGGSLTSGGTYDFRTHSGDVRLTLSGNTGFEIEASTFSGEVRSGLELKLDSMGRRNRTIRGTYGDGRARIEAMTFSGTVIINGGR